MSILSPYLQRRGDTFSFRIAVPPDLRHIIGKWEFIQSLQTTDKRLAVVKALNLAATAKQLFINLKCDMSNTDPEKLRQLLEVAKYKTRLTIEREERAGQIDEMERQPWKMEQWEFSWTASDWVSIPNSVEGFVESNLESLKSLYPTMTKMELAAHQKSFFDTFLRLQSKNKVSFSNSEI